MIQTWLVWIGFEDPVLNGDDQDSMETVKSPLSSPVIDEIIHDYRYVEPRYVRFTNYDPIECDEWDVNIRLKMNAAKTDQDRLIELIREIVGENLEDQEAVISINVKRVEE